MTSWAPTPATEWKTWFTRRSTSPSMVRAGNLLGTHRTHQPGALGSPLSR